MFLPPACVLPAPRDAPVPKGCVPPPPQVMLAPSRVQAEVFGVQAAEGGAQGARVRGGGLQVDAV